MKGRRDCSAAGLNSYRTADRVSHVCRMKMSAGIKRYRETERKEKWQSETYGKWEKRY